MVEPINVNVCMFDPPLGGRKLKYGKFVKGPPKGKHSKPGKICPTVESEIGDGKCNV
jgi:hypothetical protein